MFGNDSQMTMSKANCRFTIFHFRRQVSEDERARLTFAPFSMCSSQSSPKRFESGVKDNLTIYSHRSFCRFASHCLIYPISKMNCCEATVVAVIRLFLSSFFSFSCEPIISVQHWHYATFTGHIFSFNRCGTSNLVKVSVSWFHGHNKAFTWNEANERTKMKKKRY